jgi:flagellar motor protein MotB
MEEQSNLDFNFWPSFADLMLAVVLILVLVLFVFIAVITVGTVNLGEVQRNQMNMIEAIGRSYGVKPVGLKQDLFGISLQNNATYDIEIRNEPTLQRITFSDKILFSPDDYQINPQGQAVLRTVGTTLKQQLSLIKEIQIQGHADTNPTRFKLNVYLASWRAIEVFKFLQDSTGIDPAEHLMSATSFGEFDPVQRAQARGNYNRTQLFEDNSTPEQKGKNRRIELLLFYRR